VDKRFSGGLQLLSHYTYSRAYNHDSNYYAINHDISWGPVDFNRDHVWVLSTSMSCLSAKESALRVGQALSWITLSVDGK
jgi:hypothetical protein